MANRPKLTSSAARDKLLCKNSYCWGHYKLHFHHTAYQEEIKIAVKIYLGKILKLLDKIDEYRRNWFLHLQRMPQNRIPLKLYLYSPQGKRTIGRPKKLWREQL
jgi:hypothetical protein